MADERPRLGGEVREITVMFADLSGFTALSGRVPADELMASTNRYLALITEEVERTGGYVDKFIGDAVMALWGAPLSEPRHAVRAVDAALAIAARIATERRDAVARGEEGFWIKLGLNSGAAVIGNVGAHSRLSYTAVGETVNLAARFESLPGDYGCMIVAGPVTAAAIDGAFSVCELDLVQVKGKAAPLAVFEVFAPDCDAADYIADYGAALAAYRGRRFTDAERAWRALDYPGPIDPKVPADELDTVATPNRVMASRAGAFAAAPPPSDWRGEWVRTTK